MPDKRLSLDRSLSNRLLSLLECDFKPTDIDLFHVRPESTEQPIIENCVIGTVEYELIKLGGSPSDLYENSWFFLDVTYVIFAVALSGYCRCLLNSNGVVSKVYRKNLNLTLTNNRIK